MFNHLIARAIVPITIAVTGFVVFGCILLYSVIKSDMTAEAITHVDNLAETVSKSTRYAMMQDDRESLRNIVSNVGTLEDVGQIRIYDQAGAIRFSGMPEETDPDYRPVIAPWASRMMQPDYPERTRTHHHIGGEGLIAVSVPILNEAKCSTASCHFHSADEPVLGFLTLGISSEPLEKTLALLKSRMIVFSLMVLFLSIGGVAALLRINLFLPILRLTHAARLAVEGASAKELPKADHKLGDLERDFRLLVRQRDDALQGRQPTASANLESENGSALEARIGHDDAGHRTAAATGPGQNP